jgi:hypothetical protein
MKARTVSLLFGLIFVTVGLLGFAPNSIIGNEGFFATNAAHNLVHILTGGVFLIGAIRYPDYSGRITKLVGVAYVVVTILGFLTSGNLMLGIVHINDADRWLHLGLAIVILMAGFAFSDRKPRLTEYSVIR